MFLSSFISFDIKYLKGYTWSAAISLFSLGSCPSNGGIKGSSATTVSFDSTLGIANFSNFYINDTGTYIVVVNVRAAQNSNYNFNCLSEPIIIKNKLVSVDTTGAPNMFFNFSGNFSSLGKDDVKKIKSNFFNCIIFGKNLLTNNDLQFYQGDKFKIK